MSERARRSRRHKRKLREQRKFDAWLSPTVVVVPPSQSWTKRRGKNPALRTAIADAFAQQGIKIAQP